LTVVNKELAANTTLSHYRIVSKLGAGGMGEVYLAQDSKLDRKVALKILTAEVASNRDRMERFIREAKSAAALNHPNIAHVYEIGESDGTHFIAMEFIDGETLRKKIHRERTSLSKLLKYLNQVAEGLSKAHAAGIVHRDLKPDNIMITRDDYAKVLDFGLAKLIEGHGDAGLWGRREDDPTVAMSPRRRVSPSPRPDLSTPGLVIGTIGYMSPEQASGRVQEIDHRSDIFSFGCILFEAATGQRAFEGKDALDSLHKIVHAPTPQLKDTNPLLPEELQRIVRRCLAKEREKRYQSIKEVAIELDDLQQELKGQIASDYAGQATSSASVTTSGADRAEEGFWVAVLPFKARDSDTAVAALADGLSEEIVTGLSRFRYLSVVASDSAARLKGETGDGQALGAKLGARYVLEGSIRKGGSAIRVSAQLVDTQTGTQLWAETYNRDLETSSIFAVQDDLAARIVATVADSYGVLVHSMRDAIRQKDDAELSPEEWQFQYFAYREQITPSNHAALKNRIERAAKSDKRPSDLWACLAQVYLDEYAFGFPGHDENSLDRALVAARRAVELDRANQFAMVALAQTHFFRQDLAAFGPAAERAMALNPLNTDALGILGLEIVHTAEFERGTAIVRHAMELNPNHAGWMHFAPLWNHFHKGEYEQALECANRVDVPGLFWPYLVMASACGHLGRGAEAEAAVRDLLALDPEFAAHARSNVGTWHFASGLMDPILEGLRKAGLEINDEQPTSTSSGPSLSSSETRVDEGFWVAVLPFKYSGTAVELKALAEGLSEDIVTGLSRFSYLRVIARGSTLRYANQTTDLRTVGKELGARYVMEGTIRQAGTKLRLSVQLVDAATGTHLWAENYEREFSPENIFELQDDLVPRIVSTVADWYGVLPHSMSESVRLKPPDQLSPYEALLRSFGYFENIAPEEHAMVRSSLERAVEQEPGNADGWAMLSMIFGEEHRFGFNVEPDSLGRSLEAARQAVSIAHANHFAWLALAQALFFRKEFDPFRDAADRAIALNPMDGSTVEYLGHLIAFSGNWERGCELAERARQLNPNHPSWYWSVPFLEAYRKGDYRSARPFLLKGNPQKNYLMHALLAAVQGQLGESASAARHLREVLTMMPDFPLTGRDEFSKWYLPELVDHLMDGLRKAGLEIRDDASTSTSSAASLASKEVRAEEGFWVAVLPFRFTGSNTDVATLAEGLSEEIVTGLSRFSYLRVISCSSAVRYASETDNARAVGKTLGARYVMEGSLRLAGSMLRVAVQLVDASTGAHLWAETYDRSFRAEDIFALQDDLVPRIVSTVADQYGALVRSMSESLRGRSAGQYSAHEAVLRAFGYWERMIPEEHAEVRDILEAAVAVAPDHSDCLAELAFIYWHEYAFGYNLRPDPIGRARATAQRAVASSPTSHFAHCALATASFFQKDYLAFRPAAERALALNRMDSSTAAILGNMIAYAGDWEYGLRIVERAMQLNPHHAGWYHYVAFCDAYRRRDYSGALASALKVNMPAYHWPHVYLAAVYGQLGEQQRASAALRELHSLVPNFSAIAREEFSKWLDAELTEHLIDGLRKAGLDIL
jgi:TolB-like protein/cytochrome c-type biogenesis protein CcmH/NrfG/predicted Ser/Thr protein kinase